jgi:serine/threonine protein kinase
MRDREGGEERAQEPLPFPPLALPSCRRGSVCLQLPPPRHGLSSPATSTPVKVLQSPSGNEYLFTKRLVHEKQHVMIMLATRLVALPPAHDGQPPQRVVAPGGGQTVVIKVIELQHLRQHGGLVEDPLAEIAAMAMLSEPGHPNVLELLDYMQDEDYLYLVMPYLPGKDLYHKIKARGKGLSEARAQKITRSVIDGLLYMKAKGIAHR